MDFSHIDSLKATLNPYRLLSQNALKNFHDNLVLQWTFNSNAITGNTLTVQETKVILEAITISGKNLREHFEAILFIKPFASNDEVLSKHTIKSIHSLILKNIDENNAGDYFDIK